jgi:hypothetical protein
MAAMITPNAMMPTSQASVWRAWPSRAMRAWATVNATMKAPLPHARSPRFVLLMSKSSKRISPTAGPSVNASTDPRTATPMTMNMSRFSPARNSSCFPAPASPASFGSSVPCTAWNSRMGIRAITNAVVNVAAAALS